MLHRFFVCDAPSRGSAKRRLDLANSERIVVTSSVLVNLLSHVYADARLETVGILGGRILDNGDLLVGFATPLER
jgi:hypothetical protein